MMNYDEMLTGIIRKFGFEAPQTITFATAIEDDKMSAFDINLLYDILLADDF